MTSSSASLASTLTTLTASSAGAGGDHISVLPAPPPMLHTGAGVDGAAAHELKPGVRAAAVDDLNAGVRGAPVPARGCAPGDK